MKYLKISRALIVTTLAVSVALPASLAASEALASSGKSAEFVYVSEPGAPIPRTALPHRPRVSKISHVSNRTPKSAPKKSALKKSALKKSALKKSGVQEFACPNPLARVLYSAGFRGVKVRQAWAISMRESHGLSIGPSSPYFNGHDWGIFQLNKPTFGSKPWWEDVKILRPYYSARVVFHMSNGGASWHPWGLTGSGQLDAASYSSWSPARQQAQIMRPYLKYYNLYPCK